MTQTSPPTGSGEVIDLRADRVRIDLAPIVDEFSGAVDRPSDDIVLAAMRGEEWAVQRVFEIVTPRFVGFYRFHGMAAADAEETASHAIEAVLGRLTKLEDATSFESAAWRTARKHRVEFSRRRRSMPELPAPSPVAFDERPQEISRDERTVQAALARLSERDRDLLWLRDVEGLPDRAIGGRMAAAVGLVRVACVRARRRLRHAYKGVGRHASEIT